MKSDKEIEPLLDLKSELTDHPLVSVSSADATYEFLRALILDGRLKPAQRLREMEMSKKLGISRTPLREAFARLQSERLLERNKSGVVVADTKTRLEGIRAIRIALEAYATRLAVLNLSKADIVYLEMSIELASSLPFEAMAERLQNNSNFHRRIFGACGVAELRNAIDNYAGFFLSETDLAALSREQSKEAVQDHRTLLAAIKQRDEDSAERIMRLHVTRSFRTAPCLPETQK